MHDSMIPSMKVQPCFTNRCRGKTNGPEGGEGRTLNMSPTAADALRDLSGALARLPNILDKASPENPASVCFPPRWPIRPAYWAKHENRYQGDRQALPRRGCSRLLSFSENNHLPSIA